MVIAEVATDIVHVEVEMSMTIVGIQMVITTAAAEVEVELERVPDLLTVIDTIVLLEVEIDEMTRRRENIENAVPVVMEKRL